MCHVEITVETPSKLHNKLLKHVRSEMPNSDTIQSNASHSSDTTSNISPQTWIRNGS